VVQAEWPAELDVDASMVRTLQQVIKPFLDLNPNIFSLNQYSILVLLAH